VRGSLAFHAARPGRFRPVREAPTVILRKLR
jgi:hypothetical protein